VLGAGRRLRRGKDLHFGFCASRIYAAGAFDSKKKDEKLETFHQVILVSFIDSIDLYSFIYWIIYCDYDCRLFLRHFRISEGRSESERTVGEFEGDFDVHCLLEFQRSDME